MKTSQLSTKPDRRPPQAIYYPAITWDYYLKMDPDPKMGIGLVANRKIKKGELIFSDSIRGGEDEVLRLVFEVDRDNFVFGCDVDEFWALREYFKYALNVGRVYFFAFSAMIFLPVLLLAVARAVMFLPSARACTGA